MANCSQKTIMDIVARVACKHSCNASVMPGDCDEMVVHCSVVACWLCHVICDAYDIGDRNDKMRTFKALSILAMLISMSFTACMTVMAYAGGALICFYEPSAIICVIEVCLGVFSCVWLCIVVYAMLRVSVKEK